VGGAIVGVKKSLVQLGVSLPTSANFRIHEHVLNLMVGRLTPACTRCHERSLSTGDGV
jgi:hypothetical protein